MHILYFHFSIFLYFQIYIFPYFQISIFPYFQICLQIVYMHPPLPPNSMSKYPWRCYANNNLVHLIFLSICCSSFICSESSSITLHLLDNISLMVPQDFPRYNLEEMLKIQRPNIQGFEFMSKGCKSIDNIKRASPKNVRIYARQCQKTSWGQAVPS